MEKLKVLPQVEQWKMKTQDLRIIELEKTVKFLVDENNKKTKIINELINIISEIDNKIKN